MMKSQLSMIFMNFFVIPHEICRINKQGGQNKLGGVCKNHEKINALCLVYFEPESSWLVSVCL